METYLRIRNNLFLVSFWKRASLHFACRPSRPGKTKFRQRFAVGITFYWVQLETYLCLEIPNWKPICGLEARTGIRRCDGIYLGISMWKVVPLFSSEWET